MAPSRWIAECSCKSRLFSEARTEYIATGVDSSIFYPKKKQWSRQLLGLPANRKLLLFGAVNPLDNLRKGATYLLGALKLLAKQTQDPLELPHLVIFGSYQTPFELQQYSVTSLGHLYDDVTLALLYSACDLFVAPSLEENLANTVLESLACGTLVVAFRVGGMPDAIQHQSNGWLTDEISVTSLCEGIVWGLQQRWNEEKRIETSTEMKKKFCLKQSGISFLQLFRELQKN